MSSHYFVKQKSAKFYRTGCQSEWGILSRQSSCQEATARHIYRKFHGLVLSFNKMVHWRIEHATPSLSCMERKVPDFVSPTLWSPNSPDLNSNDYSIWSVDLMQEKVY